MQISTTLTKCKTDTGAKNKMDIQEIFESRNNVSNYTDFAQIYEGYYESASKSVHYYQNLTGEGLIDEQKDKERAEFISKIMAHKFENLKQWALAEHLEESPFDIATKDGKLHYTLYQDRDYLVLTLQEAEEAAREAVFDGVKKEVEKEIPRKYHRFIDIDKYAEYLIRHEGKASYLAPYDHEEYTQNGFLIYRVH